MSRRSSRARLFLLLGATTTILLLALAIGAIDETELRPVEVQPPGRWHFEASRLAESPTGDELARVLSLPYLSGKTVAVGQGGVVLHRRDGTFEGLNLYVSGHGPIATLMDIEGKTLHKWRFPFESAFPEKQPTMDTPFFRRAHLLPNGDLLVLFQSGGIIKLDRDSKLLWASDLPAYNHLSVTASGNIVTISKSARSIPRLRQGGPVLEDSIVTLDPDGNLLNRISLLECFENSEFFGMLGSLPDHADIFHSNTVIPISETEAGYDGPWELGDFIVSIRELDIVAVVDPDSRSVRTAWQGPWVAQHQPVPLPTGKILLFDNRGVDPFSRVLEFDPSDGRITWEFSGTDSGRLASPEAGSCQRLPNGNTLITDSEQGRALEITPEQEVVWEFISPHRAGSRGELVATLFEVVRIPGTALDFLSIENRG